MATTTETTTIKTTLPSSLSNLPTTSVPSTTERPPTDVSILKLTPDVNHALTIEHQNQVINLGQSLSMGITNAIVRPLTFFNNLIGSAAGSLPALFAANGAALGTAIATPIQLGTLAANAAISGITGTIVSIPISLASGGVAQIVGLVGTGRQLWQQTLGSDPATSPFWQNGEVWLQPLAVVTGANSILAGVSMNVLSQGVKNLGLGIERFGLTLSHTGQSAKRLGSILVGWANGRPLYAPVVNNTDTNEINVDLSELALPVNDGNETVTIVGNTTSIDGLITISLPEIPETPETSETTTAVPQTLQSIKKVQEIIDLGQLETKQEQEQEQPKPENILDSSSKNKVESTTTTTTTAAMVLEQTTTSITNDNQKNLTRN